MQRPDLRRGLAGLLALCLLALAAPALSEAGSEAAGGKPIVAKIHADWCGTCTRLEPTWQALQARYGEQVRFVVLDVTDKDAVARSATEAEQLGITGFFDKYKGITGVVGVIDPRGETSVFRGELNAGRYEAPITAAIGAS